MLVRTLTLVGLTCCLLAGGCTDEQAAQSDAATRQVLDAIHNVALADSGFVPKGDESEVEYLVDGKPTQVQLADLAAYRQEMFQGPIKQLESVLADESNRHNGPARRLLADLRASGVRHRTHQAMLDWVDVSGKQATLLRYLAAVDWADARQHQLRGEDPSEQIEQLQQDKRALRAKLEQLKKASVSLQETVDTLSQQIDQGRRAAGAALAESQHLQAEAMRAAGEARFDFHQRSTEQQRKSDERLAEAQVLEVQRDVKQSELHLTKVRLGIATDQLKALDRALDAEDQRLDQTKEKLLEAEAAKAQAVQKMLEYHNGIAEAYAKSVDAVLSSNVEELATIIGDIDTVAKDTRGPARQSVQLEKLAYIMEQIYVLSSYSMASGDYSSKLALVSDQAKRTMPEHAKAIETKHGHVRTVHDQAVDRTATTIGQARELIEEIKAGVPTEDHPIAVILAQQEKRLEGYDRRMNGSVPLDADMP